MKRIFEEDSSQRIYYYDLARITRIAMDRPADGVEDQFIGIIYFDDGTHEQNTFKVAKAIKDAWITYIEGSA